MVLTMQIKRLEKWTWLLIYGGMLGISLGWFIQTGEAPDYLAEKLQTYHKTGIIKYIAGAEAP